MTPTEKSHPFSCPGDHCQRDWRWKKIQSFEWSPEQVVKCSLRGKLFAVKILSLRRAFLWLPVNIHKDITTLGGLTGHPLDMGAYLQYWDRFLLVYPDTLFLYIYFLLHNTLYCKNYKLTQSDCSTLLAARPSLTGSMFFSNKGLVMKV